MPTVLKDTVVSAAVLVPTPAKDQANVRGRPFGSKLWLPLHWIVSGDLPDVLFASSSTTGACGFAGEVLCEAVWCGPTVNEKPSVNVTSRSAVPPL